MEIERKFLVECPPDSLLKGSSVEQGYLFLPDDRGAELRVRRTDRAPAVLTIKAGRGLAREEIEIPISPAQFEKLWILTDGHRIQKTRYKIHLPAPEGKRPESLQLVAELDIYSGHLEGLATVEVEFPSEEEAAGFQPPAWFGRELTDDPSFRNSSLAA